MHASTADGASQMSRTPSTATAASTACSKQSLGGIARAEKLRFMRRVELLADRFRLRVGEEETVQNLAPAYTLVLAL